MEALLEYGALGAVCAGMGGFILFLVKQHKGERTETRAEHVAERKEMRKDHANERERLEVTQTHTMEQITGVVGDLKDVIKRNNGSPR